MKSETQQQRLRMEVADWMSTHLSGEAQEMGT